ncbi:MAPEG family protein [Aquabacterium sp.]|uniref:MAPEG family protein n=1 Tax=Aquabacterium sp. TaxID=1872578 RepID=UPI002E316682|nr:MAPEG family protein [Aquabacterium sp.]HEX5312242.1 MAPEG family protein [Aquabacterium sp.]
MTIANWCVVAAAVLPILTVGMAKASSRGSRKNGGYDNNNPRQWEEKLQGWKQRAVAAQNNGFEALPLFAAAVLMAQQAHADQSRIDQLALGFIVVRLVYVALYLKDLATLRSLVWAIGLGISITLVAMAA